jgi:hypothetical protein
MEMRTTLTIEDDVAARLEKIVRTRRQPLKAVINETLRAGLDALALEKPARQTFRTRGFNLGPRLVGSLDNIEEILSRVDGEDHR